mgnify:FL=1
MLNKVKTQNQKNPISYNMTFDLQVSQGDEDAADVIMDINEKVNGDNLTAEQQQLVSEQEQQAENLEGRQRSEQRDMNRSLNDEMAEGEKEVEDQIAQQKRLVSFLGVLL